jgi:hypothetical protein
MDETELVALFGVYAGRISEEQVIDKDKLSGLKIVLDDGAVVSYTFPRAATREKRIAAFTHWRRYVRKARKP